MIDMIAARRHAQRRNTIGRDPVSSFRVSGYSIVFWGGSYGAKTSVGLIRTGVEGHGVKVANDFVLCAPYLAMLVIGRKGRDRAARGMGVDLVGGHSVVKEPGARRCGRP